MSIRARQFLLRSRVINNWPSRVVWFSGDSGDSRRTKKPSAVLSRSVD